MSGAQRPAATGLGDVARRAFAAARPMGAMLELTYACNWRCVFCYNPRHHDRRRLELDDWRAVLDGLRRLGTMQVTLTGGEPLAHPAFFDVAAAARERAMVVRLFTNGALVTDAAVARRIAALQPLTVELSLHGADAATHDATTGRPGSFDAMWRGLDLLLAEGVRVVLKTPVTRLNEHQLDDMVALADRRGLPYRLDGSITPRDDGDLSPQQYTASDAGLRRMYEILVEQTGRSPKVRRAGEANCGLGRVGLVVDPEGNVFPCMQWRSTSLGNVRDQPIDAMWRDSMERRRLGALAVRVNDHLVRSATPHPLSFCPALALQRTGDPLGTDPEYGRGARLFLEAWRSRSHPDDEAAAAGARPR